MTNVSGYRFSCFTILSLLFLPVFVFGLTLLVGSVGCLITLHAFFIFLFFYILNKRERNFGTHSYVVSYETAW